MIEIQLHKILNSSLCWDILREVRWSAGVCCPACQSKAVVKNGKDTVHLDKQHYQCKTCSKHFDDLTDTIFSPTAGGQPLHHWITTLYVMHLHASKSQVAAELEVSEQDKFNKGFKR